MHHHPRCTALALADSTAATIAKGIDAVIGPRGLDTLQYEGGMCFCLVVASAAAAKKLNAAGFVTLSDTKTPVQCVGPQVVVVTVLRLKPFIG